MHRRSFALSALAVVLTAFALLFSAAPSQAFAADPATGAGPVYINGGKGSIALEGTDADSPDDPANPGKKVFRDMNGITARMEYNATQTPEPYSFKVVVSGANPDVKNTLKIDTALGMYLVDYGANNTQFTGQMDGKAAIEQHPDTQFIYGRHDRDGIVLRNVRRSTKSATWTAKSGASGGAISYGTEIVVSPELFYHYKNIENALTITYTEDAGGPNEKQYTISCNAAVDLPGYSGLWNSTINYAAGDSINFDKYYLGQYRLQGTVAQNVKFVYSLPKGVDAALDENIANVNSMYKTYMQDGKLVVENLIPYAGWSYGSMASPIKFDVASTAAENLTVPVAITLTTLDGYTFLEKNITLTLKRQAKIDGSHVYVQHDSGDVALANPTKRAGTRLVGCVPPEVGYGAQAHAIRVGNVGKAASQSQTLRLKFDAANFRILGVQMSTLEPVSTFTVTTVNAAGKTIKNKHVVTLSSPKQWNGTGELTGFNSMVSWKELGLTEEERLSELSYELGVLEPETSSSAGVIFEALTPLSRTENTKLCTVECYSTQNPSDTTGEGFCNIVADQKAIGMFSGAGQRTVNTGSVSEQQQLTMNSNGRILAAKDPAVYICVPDGVSITDVKVSSNQHGDFTNEVQVIGPLVSTGAKGTKTYYKLAFKHVTNNKGNFVWSYDSNGRIISQEIQVNWKYKTSPTAQTGEYPNADNIFIEYPGLENSFKGASSNYYRDVDGNPYGFPGVGKLVTVPNDNSLKITPKVDIVTYSSAKTEEMTDYINYDGTPQSVLPIGVTATDKVNLRTTITNNSGVATSDGTTTGTHTTVWVPIPKKGQNWQRLTEGCKDTQGKATKTLPFSLNLLGPVEGVDTNVWDVYYGVGVKPPTTDSYPETWDEGNGNWLKNPNSLTADQLKQVSCIKLVARENIPAFENANSNVPYATNLIASVAVDEADKTQKNSVVVVAPLIYRNLTASDGTPCVGVNMGAPTAVTIARGKIKGEVFNDNNHNGQKDAGEPLVTPADGTFTVNLYGGAGNKKTLLKKTTVTNGSYRFQGLATGNDYKNYYSVEILNRDGQPRDFRLLGAKNIPTGDEMVVTATTNTTHRGEGNAYVAAGDGKNNERGTYASLTNVEPRDVDEFDHITSTTGGLYNLGVYSANEMTTIKFKVDTTKGTLAAPTQGSWVKVNDADAADGTLSYSAAASDVIAWPADPTTGEAYAFKGWKLEGAEDSTAAAAQKNAKFGFKDVTYEAVFETLTANYKVELWYMEEYGLWRNPTVRTFTGIIGQEVSFNPASATTKGSKKYTVSKYKTKSTVTKGKVAADGSLTLKVYYDIAKGPDPCFWDITHAKKPDGTNEQWFAGKVHDANDIGLIKGYEEPTKTINGKELRPYGHGDKITRAQIVVILWRMAGRPTATIKTNFTDVKRYDASGDENYYWMATLWAKEKGISDGYTSGPKKGQFGWKDPVTREQLAGFLGKYSRVIAKKNVSGSESDYSKMTDKAKVSANMRSVLGWCFKNKILEGTAKTQEIKPKGNATRADAAKMFVNFYELLEKE